MDVLTKAVDDFHGFGQMLVLDKHPRGLTWGMLLSGALLLVYATTRGVSDWRQKIAEQQLEPVTVLQTEQLGFVPMLSPMIGANAGQRGEAGRPPAESLSPEGGKAQAAGIPAVDPRPAGDIPVRILIPAIDLDAPVVGSGLSMVRLDSEYFYQWNAPDYFAAGWDANSSRLGTGGNSVLIGHHNIDGEVFRDLHLLQPGDIVVIFGQAHQHRYRVVERLILKEKYQDVETRLSNARYIEPTSDERLTLVTCWPYVSNTHRLIVIAKPVDSSQDRGRVPPE